MVPGSYYIELYYFKKSVTSFTKHHKHDKKCRILTKKDLRNFSTLIVFDQKAWPIAHEMSKNGRFCRKIIFPNFPNLMIFDKKAWPIAHENVEKR